ncbi:MAG: DUF6318 family protein [Quadrisphaera sp.]
MIDQRLPPLPRSSPEGPAHRRFSRVGTVVLVVLGLLGGFFITLPTAWSVMWVSGSYLFLGDGGLEHALETLGPREELPDAGPPPRAPVATQDAEGAAAAARSFVASYEYAYLSGDPAWIEEVSTPRCATCASAVAALTLADEGGYRFFMMDFRPTAVTVTSFTPERAVVHLSVTTADAVLSTGGTSFADLGGGNVENDVVLVWQEDRWLVDSLDGGLWAPVQGS